MQATYPGSLAARFGSTSLGFARRTDSRTRRRWVHIRVWRVAARWTLIGLSLALLTRLGVAGWPEIQRAASVLATQQGPLLALVLLLEVAWSLALAQLSRSSVTAVGGRLATRDAVRISLASFTLSRVVPGGGAAGGVFATRELIVLGNPAPVALTAMVVSWAVATMTLASLVSTGLLAAALTGDLPSSSLLPSSALLAVLAALALVAIRALYSERLRHRLEGLVARALVRFPKGADTTSAWIASLDEVASSLRHPARLLAAAGWSASAWLFDAAALWLMFFAFGHPLGLRELVIGYAAANLINTLPELTPGWLGVFEAALAATYVALGVPSGVAVAAVLSYRLVSFWLPVAAGVMPALTSLAAHRRAALSVPTTAEVAA